MADPEKQFPATPRKRQEARQKGQVVKSQEINSVFILLGGLMTLRFIGPMIFEDLSYLTTKILTLTLPELTPVAVIAYSPVIILAFGKMIAPILAVTVVFGVLANVLQFGFLLTGEPLIPKLSKINPISGFSRLFSMRSVMELFKSIFKIGIIGFVSYLTLKGETGNVFSYTQMENIDIFISVCQVTFKLFFRICLVLVIIAFLDFLFQKWQMNQDLKMTRREVKDEVKRTEGDPLIRQRIRTIQRQLANQRMMAEVPQADVVITNPTELALAVKYDVEERDAPYIVAKGARLLAQKIKDIAREHDIPIVENKPLAQVLYKTVDVGMDVPAKFYRAVAEILAYVYRLKGKV